MPNARSRANKTCLPELLLVNDNAMTKNADLIALIAGTYWPKIRRPVDERQLDLFAEKPRCGVPSPARSRARRKSAPDMPAR